MASSSSPCAACKFLRRKCTQECVFAPYFPPEQPQKFAFVHKVFGASNVAKLLNELAVSQREDAVNSLFYEAEARLRDPVYGCVGLISILQHRYKELQHDLENAKKELATYVGPQAMLPMFQPLSQSQFMSSLPPPPLRPSSSSSPSVLSTQHHQNHHHNMLPMSAIPSAQLYHHHQQQQQQIFEAQQLAGVITGEQQNEMFRGYGGGSNSPHHHHQNQPQVEILRFNNGFDSVPNGSVTITGFNQGGTNVTGMSLGSNFVDSPPTNNNYNTDQQLHQQQHQLFIPTQSSQPLQLQTQESQTQTQTNSESEDGRKNVIVGLFR